MKEVEFFDMIEVLTILLPPCVNGVFNQLVINLHALAPLKDWQVFGLRTYTLLKAWVKFTDFSHKT